MIEAIKDNWWYTPPPTPDEPDPEPVIRLGWRPIDPYCEQYATEWRGINPYCLKDSNNNNTGYRGYANLEEWTITLNERTGSVKPNVSSDPDYISPTYNTSLCPLPVIVDPNEPVITSSTKIRLIFDSTGSMKNIEPKLQAMIAPNGPLFNRLVNYYGSTTKFNQYVSVESFPHERTLVPLGQYLNGTDPVIDIVFQNEAEDTPHAYHFSVTKGEEGMYDPWTINTPRTTSFDNDMDSLRQRLVGYDNKKFNGIIMAIDTYVFNDVNPYTEFSDLFKAVKAGQGVYTGNYSFDGLPINVKANLLPPDVFFVEDFPKYYSDKTIEALNELGFNIP